VKARQLAEFEQGVALHKFGIRVTNVLRPTLCRILVMKPLRQQAGRGTTTANALERHCKLCRRCKLGRE
jgi:hypothetical protein